LEAKRQRGEIKRSRVEVYIEEEEE